MDLRVGKAFLASFAAAALATVVSGDATESRAATPRPDAPLAAQPADDDCSRTACREGGFQIALRVDEKRYISIPVTRSPYVLADGSILTFPGETLVFQFSMEGEKLGAPKFVAAYEPDYPAQRDPQGDGGTVSTGNLPKLTGALPKDQLAAFPPGTFIVSYGQFKDRSMNLTMRHNLPHTMKLDAVMAVITPEKYLPQYTSTCPLMPNVFGNEMWLHPVGPMVLRNFRFLPDGAPMVCD
jgi:hypothetical protein